MHCQFEQRASKWVDRIIIDDNAKYNPQKLFINSDLSESNEKSIVASKNLFSSRLVSLASIPNIPSDFNQFYGHYIRNKSTRTILQ